MQIKLSELENPKIALCLSGGGLRATFFHFGVIKALRDTKVNGVSLLSKISDIYSVSGGSIIAAHLIKNWNLYTGDDAKFKEAISSLYKVAARDIRGQVLRAWALSLLALAIPRLRGKKRTYWLEQEYAKIYGNQSLASFYRTEKGLPKLHILTTAFHSGELCSFSPSGFEIIRNGRGALQKVSTPADSLSMAFSVAASSAFPPMFPPIEVTSEMLGYPDLDDFKNSIYLSDGGVFDNLGVEKLCVDLELKQTQANAVIVSNAGSSFKSTITSKFSNIFARNIRATDIMMRRVADNTEDKMFRLAGLALMPLKIGDTVNSYSLAQVTQKLLRNVRTDLDNFSETLVKLLADHGEQVALNALQVHGLSVSQSNVQPDNFYENQESLTTIASLAANRSKNPFNLRDWKSYAVIAFVVGYVIFAGYAWIAPTIDARKAKAAEAEVLAQNKKAAEDYKQQIAQVQDSTIIQLRNEIVELKNKLKLPPSENLMFDKPHRVWLQFAGSIQREEMKEFGKKIKEKWPNTQGAEQGGERTQNAAGMLEVRYGDEKDKNAAIDLTKDVLRTNIVKLMKETKRVEGIPSGSLEIWISR